MDNIYKRLNLQKTNVCGSTFNFTFNKNIFVDYNNVDKIKLLKIISKTICIYTLALCQILESNEENVYFAIEHNVCKTSVIGLVSYYFACLYYQSFKKKIFEKNTGLYSIISQNPNIDNFEKYIKCSDNKIVDYLNDLYDWDYFSDDYVKKPIFPLIAETNCKYVTTGASINTYTYAVKPKDQQPEPFININSDGIKIKNKYMIISDDEIDKIGTYTDHDNNYYHKTELFCDNSMCESYGNLSWYKTHINKLQSKTIESEILRKHITFDFSEFAIKTKLLDNNNYIKNTDITCTFSGKGSGFYFAGTPCNKAEIKMIKYLDSERIIDVSGPNKVELRFNYDDKDAKGNDDKDDKDNKDNRDKDDKDNNRDNRDGKDNKSNDDKGDKDDNINLVNVTATYYFLEIL